MVDTRIPVMILQHPQEEKKPLSTSPLMLQVFKRVKIRRGLSWRSLSHAWGEPIRNPREWGVLFVGSKAQSKQMRPFPESLSGLIALDGTWAQSRTLWWRNPWLLKCSRLNLKPAEVSRYGQLRKEPRPDCLSTYEAILLALDQYKYISENEKTFATCQLDAFLSQNAPA